MSKTPSFDRRHVSVENVEHKPLEEVEREDPRDDYPGFGLLSTDRRAKLTPWPKGGFKRT